MFVKSCVSMVALAAVSGLATETSGASPSLIALGDLPGGSVDSLARAVSGDGSTVVGFSESASGRQAFRWTAGGGMVGLGDLPGGIFQSSALGVSGDGSTVVGRGASATGFEAYRWTAGGGMVGLGDLPGGTVVSVAFGVSGDGSTAVGQSSSTSGFEAFRWTAGGGMAYSGIHWTVCKRGWFRRFHRKEVQPPYRRRDHKIHSTEWNGSYLVTAQ